MTKVRRMATAVRATMFLAYLRASGGWESARSVADKNGLGLMAVAFALRDLAERGLLEEDVVGVAGKCRMVEHSRRYRARPFDGGARITSDLPAWVAPRGVVDIGVRRLIQGRAGMRRWAPEDVEVLEKTE